MTKSIETLVEDIYHVLDPTNDHIVNEENLEAFGEAVKDAVRDQLRTRKQREGTLRFSGIGKQPRQLWYDAHVDASEAEPLEPQAGMKFLYGHIIEAVALLLCKEAGHNVSDEQKEVEVDGVKGHLDAIIDGHVVDVKSASPFGFKKFAEGEITPKDDSFGYIRQLSGYATCEEKPAAFLAIDKVAGRFALSPLSSYAIKGHPPAPRIAMLKEVLAKDEPPERCYPTIEDGKSGNRRLSMECGYCKWRELCWADANGGKGLRTFLYSNGPRFLTKVEREPDVYEATKSKSRRDPGEEVQEE